MPIIGIITRSSISYKNHSTSIIYKDIEIYFDEALNEGYKCNVLNKVTNENIELDILSNSVRFENPDEKYIYIMYALDSFVLNEGEPSFGLYIRNEHHVSNGTDTQHAFRPQVLWYDIMPSKVNTINSVKLTNGILTEKFDPEAVHRVVQTGRRGTGL